MEAELAREEFAVDAEGVPREGAAAEGQDGDAGDDLAQALEVAAEGERVGEQEVRPADRLAALRAMGRRSVYAAREGVARTWRWVYPGRM